MKKRSAATKPAIIIALILVFLIITVISCRKNSKDTSITAITVNNLETNLSPEINELKTIYLNGIKSSTSLTTNSTGEKKFKFIRNLNVKWTRFLTDDRLDSSRLVEFDMEPDSGKLIPKRGSLADTSYFANKTSLVFIKFKDGRRLNFFMKVVEDYSDTHVSTIRKMDYMHIPKTFSGLVYFLNLDQTFINGYRYTYGRITGKLGSMNVGTPSGQQTQSTTKLRTNTYDSECGWFDYYWVWTPANGQPTEYDYAFSEYIDCVEGTSGGVTGGGGGPGAPPPSTPTQPYCPALQPDSRATIKVNVYNPDDGDDPHGDPPPPPAQCPTQMAFKIAIHKIIMTNAAVQSHICARALADLISGVEDTDYDTTFGTEPGTSTFHFDNLKSYDDNVHNWNLLNGPLLEAEQNSNFYTMGFLLHAYQDFYSHSNYAELLIKYYGDDAHNVAFSTVLHDNTGAYDGLKALLRTDLRTGSFDWITYFFGTAGAWVQQIDYTTTHNYINKDDANTYAGDFAARLAQRETYLALQNVVNKCK